MTPKTAPIPYVPCNPTNYSKGRTFPDGPLHGHAFVVDSVALHRTAVTGDTALGECHHFAQPNLEASFHEAIGTDGKRCASVHFQDRAWAVIGGTYILNGKPVVDSRIANYRTKSIELCGLNGTALTPPQLASVIQAIKDAKTESPGIVLQHITVADLKAGKPGLYNHLDATTAFAVPKGHVDFILPADWAKIMAGLAPKGA